mgnify:CR=1 FL=1
MVRANKDTVWHICAEFDQEEIMEYLTTMIEDFNINCQNLAGETALMVAAREGNLAIIKYMLGKFVQNEKNTVTQKKILEVESRSKDGWTAFLYAAINGYLNTTEYLAVECKSDVNVVDKMRRSALHWAARFNNPQMVNLLIRLKVDERAIDVDRMTPKDLAKAHS